MDPIEKAFEAAAADRSSGASAIERRLLGELLGERERWSRDALTRGGARLSAGQPAMANLRNLARCVACDDLDAVAAGLARRAAVLDGLDDIFAAAAWPLVEGCRRLLTVSRSSAVAAVVEGAWRHGWRGEVVVFDGTSSGRGRDQARALAAVSDGVRSQPDAAMPVWLEGDGCLIVVGADAVSPTRFVNACGTRTLVELAAARSLRSAVVADSGKDLPDDELEEILAAGPVAEEAGAGRRWPIFEAVPMSLVNERIRE